MFGKKTTLSRQNIKSVLNAYSKASWEELESGAASFLPEAGRYVLREKIRNMAPGFLDGSYKPNYEDFSRELQDVHQEAIKTDGYSYSLEELMELLYTLGIYTTANQDAKGQLIIHSYHRGNRYPQKGRGSKVRLHQGILMAFG